MKTTTLALACFFTLGIYQAHTENLHFVCNPRNERETPYRTFNVTVFNADTREAESEISYDLFPNKDATYPDSAGLLDGFARSETYSTQVTSRYRMIRIEGGRFGITWQRDVLQLQKIHGTEYRGLFEFPEGSDQLELPWNSTLVLLCQRT